MHRVVDHQRLRVNMLENMGGGYIGHVKGRVLAHQHHVQFAQVSLAGLAQGKMIALLTAHLQGPQYGPHLPVKKTQVAGQIMKKLVAARLGLQRQGKGAVAVDIDIIERVHLYGDGECLAGHNLSLSSLWRGINSGYEDGYETAGNQDF